MRGAFGRLFPGGDQFLSERILFDAVPVFTHIDPGDRASGGEAE